MNRKDSFGIQCCKCMNESMDERGNGWMDRWMDGRMDRRVGGGTA